MPRTYRDQTQGAIGPYSLFALAAFFALFGLLALIR